MINHLAIIMDGNRRWANQRSISTIIGHKKGADNIEKVSKLCIKKGIKYLTLWGLSTENLSKRSQDEIKNIISIIDHSPKYLKSIIKGGVKINLIGDISKLPEKSQDILNSLVKETEKNDELILTLALIYGGRDEIIRGIREFIKSGGDIDDLDEDNFRNYIDTREVPMPDIIVRTGGDIRHSGFLLYDSVYSEYYFSQKKWPEFDEEELDKVIDFFSSAKRNFGK